MGYPTVVSVHEEASVTWSFNCFLILQVCEENPNATFAEISTIMGDKWKNVSEEERKPYEDRYKVEKDVYLKVCSLSMCTSKLNICLCITNYRLLPDK